VQEGAAAVKSKKPKTIATLINLMSYLGCNNGKDALEYSIKRLFHACVDFF
jgi:hypothetical protein